MIASADASPIRVVLNEEEISVGDLCFAYGEGELFDCRPDAQRMLKLLALGPMEQMIPFLYYRACLTCSEIVLTIREAIRSAEGGRVALAAEDGREPRCIYCLASEGDFSAEDHVIPESLGNDELVLREAVCDACNNSLSRLEQSLLDFEPVALLRVLNVPYTKKGKFPRAEFRDFTMEKVRPREVKFISKTTKEIFTNEEEVSPGLIRFSTSVLSRRPFDPVLLGRAVFKIGLGLVAYDGGVECACSPRYDVARDFIAGNSGMPNHLLMERTTVPDQSLLTEWRDVGSATPVMLSLYGLRLSFNLEATPYPVAGVALPEGFMQFWLGGEGRGGASPTTWDRPVARLRSKIAVRLIPFDGGDVDDGRTTPARSACA